MNKKNTDYLIQTYSPLYENCPVFDCEDGWFKILDDLSASVHYILLKTGCECRVSQVKEKFGTLRVYMDSSLDEIDELIRDAEFLSSKTCEYCGKAGGTKGSRWNYTSCNKCDKNNKESNINPLSIK